MDIRLADVDQKTRYKLLIGLVYPRPIALVSTINANGVLNAAPFSFFNVVADEPPLVLLSFNRRSDGALKDTVKNIRRTNEFAVNLVDEAIANAMLAAGQELPDTESTLAQAKLEFKFNRESRQNLTVFFIDIVNYTEKTTRLGPSEMMKLIKSFEDLVGEAVEEYQGRVVKKMGDGILASFKLPAAAAAAALRVQKKLGEFSSMKVGYEKMEARIGLNSGMVTRRGKDIFGDVVNVASRMQSAATPGDILLTEDTFKEIRSYVKCTELGKIKVKGITDPITAYSALDLIADPSKVITPGVEPRLEQLKESIFVPTFTVPAAATDNEKLTGLLKEIFSEVSRAVEELAADYHDEYEFKKYLQEKWNALMESL